MSDEDRDLDRQWRSRYGEPLPMLGSADIVRTILARNIPPMVAGNVRRRTQER